MNTDELEEILRCSRTTLKIMEHLPSEHRTMALMGLIAQEICNHPPNERAAELDAVLRFFPQCLQSTEEGMREALIESVRQGI